MLSILRRIARPHGRYAFIRGLAPKAGILDVGCGNNSPYRTKRILPQCHYTGIDIGDYNQTTPMLADRYILTSPEEFTAEIARHVACFDAVISAHNLEHCLHRQHTLHAMIQALRPGGRLYLSFPAEASVHFAHRRGSLNYYDDSTHTATPPHFEAIIAQLQQVGLQIDFAAPQYRPTLLRMVGMLQEPYSRLRGRICSGTWAYYGFETVIWATKTIPKQEA